MANVHANYSQDHCQNNPEALRMIMIIIIMFFAKHDYSIRVIIVRPTGTLIESRFEKSECLLVFPDNCLQNDAGIVIKS